MLDPQYRSNCVAPAPDDGLRQSFAVDIGPGHHDVAHYIDEAGFDTVIVIAYWDVVEAFHSWLAIPSLADWWNNPGRASDGVGYFREFVCPRARHFETLFSTSDRFEEVACLAEGPSGEIREHSYWGSARDRLPIAQIDGLRASGALKLLAQPRPGERVRGSLVLRSIFRRRRMRRNRRHRAMATKRCRTISSGKVAELVRWTVPESAALVEQHPKWADALVRVDTRRDPRSAGPCSSKRWPPTHRTAVDGVAEN